MNAERLSRLQKWILKRAYQNEHHGEGNFGKWVNYPITKAEIYRDYFELDIEGAGLFRSYGPFGGFRFVNKEAAKIKTVILSRSLAKLRARGYIMSFSAECGHGLGQNFELTKKGIAAAKSIIGNNGLEGLYNKPAEDIDEQT